MTSQIPRHWLIWAAPNQNFFPFHSLNGRLQCNSFTYTLHSSLEYDRQQCYLYVPVNANNHRSRKQSWSSSLWLLEQETRTNENPQDDWGWQKEKNISPSTASLKQESKWPCKFLQVTSKLEAYVLHGNQES